MNWWGGPNQILLRAPKRLGPALQIGYGSLVFTPTKWTGHWGQAYWVWVPDVNVPSEGRQQSARQGAVCAERHDASTAIVTILHPESVFPWLTWTLLTLRHTKIHFCCIFSQKKKRELVETIQMSWIHLNLLCIFATIISKGLFTVGKRTMAIFKPLLIFLHCVSYHSHGQYHL